jgi:serine/threonine-protein kinase
MRLCRKCNNLYPDDIDRCLIDGTPLEKNADPFVGKLIGGCYRIDSKLAAGGMGDVYRAHHEYIDLEVAIKILKPLLRGSEEFRLRTMREARICATIEHGNIVKAYDLVTSDGLVCLVMELLRGETLRGRLRREGTLDVPRSLRILSQTAEALANAHSLDVVHRDIKPSNIFLAVEHGLDDFVKLLDFGIAYALKEGRLTQDGQVMGTPPYMPPELLQGNEPTKASDIYALACVVYRMLGGRTPFAARDLPDVISGHLRFLPPPITELRPEVPPELEAILLRMLEKRPDDRYQDAFELLHALKTSGLYLYGVDERPSEVDIEQLEIDQRPVRTGWGTYFDGVASGGGEATGQSESFQKGVSAAAELARIEEEKKAIVARIERIEARRRGYQRNITRAIKTLREDLSGMRDRHEREQMEYVKVRTEREFLSGEVGRLASALGERVGGRWNGGDADAELLALMAEAGGAASRLLEVRSRSDEIGQARGGYREGVEDVKFQLSELARRLREVEQETVREYEELRARLDELSARGEELRKQAAIAACMIESGRS